MVSDYGSDQLGDRRAAGMRTPDDVADGSDGAYREPPDVERPLGELVGDLTRDMSTLVRQEIELAKAELREEAVKTGKAAGMLGAAGLAGYMVLLFLSLTIMWALAEVLPIGWAALIVTGIWAVVGAVLYARGRSRLRSVDPTPRQTVETIKEDVQWAKTRNH
jgi:uncharacterized membrane protein YqjE